MKQYVARFACLLLVLYYSCEKPEEQEEQVPLPSTLRIEATVPAKVWDNASRVYLDATRTNTFNGRRELSYTWSLKEAPAGVSVNTLRDSDQPLARLDSPFVIGMYKIELLVADKNNPATKSTATYQLEVLPDTLYLYPPRADAGDDQVITAPDNKVTLNGLRTYHKNPIGRAQTIAWSVISQPPSSPPVSIFSPDRLITDVYPLVEGKYLFRMEVINEKKLTAMDTVQVTVLPDPFKGTVMTFNDLEWQREEFEDWGWGPSTQVVLYVTDPSLSVKRIPGNTDVRVWIDAAQNWSAPNEYLWYIYSDGTMQVIHPQVDEKVVGKKTRVEVRFR